MRVKNYLKASFIGSVVLVVAGSVLLLSSMVYYGGKSQEEEKDKLTLPVASIEKTTASAVEVGAILKLLSNDLNVSSGEEKQVEFSYKNDVINITVKNKEDYSRFTLAITKLNFLSAPYKVEIQSLCLGSKSCASKAFYDFSGVLVKKEIVWH